MHTCNGHTIFWLTLLCSPLLIRLAPHSNTTLKHTEAVFWFLIPTIGAALTGTFFLTNIGTTLTSFLLLSITFFCSSFVYLVVSILAMLITHYSPTTSGQVKTKVSM